MKHENLIEVINLKKYFPINTGFIESFRHGDQYLRAVDDVNFTIPRGEIFGLAGESGCGKTTLGRTLIRLTDPTDGAIFFKGTNISFIKGQRLKKLRRDAQIIFQDPYGSLNPRKTVYDTIVQPLNVHNIVEEEEEKLECVKMILDDVRLETTDDFLFKYPHELSGGQRQRIAFARALILKPSFVVADEPVSMLDMSIRSELLNLILNLQQKHDLTLLFITHDLAVARYICERLGIMYLGIIAELGATEDVVSEPLHPYTKILLSAVPVADPDRIPPKLNILGEIPSPLNIPSGCRFHPRCPDCIDICKIKVPEFKDIGGGRIGACHVHFV